MMTRSAVVRNPALASRVRRYHTWPVLHQETVGEHTFNVLRIHREIFGLVNTRVVEYVIDHDLTEIATGDLPFPVKTRNPALKAEMDRIEADASRTMGLSDYCPSHQDKLRVKVCDLLQMWEFGKIELRMGNLLARPICDDTSQAVMAITRGADFPEEDHDKVVKWMQENEL